MEDNNKTKKELLTEVIDATVIAVGNIEEENNEDDSKFSYKYEFINPITNETCIAEDEMPEVEVGEQIFEEGDEIQIIFSERIKRINMDCDYSVTRCKIYPNEIKKGKRKKRLLKILYLLALIIISCICTFKA